MTSSPHTRLWLVILFLITLALSLLRYSADRSITGSFSLAWPDNSIAHFRLTALIIALIVGANLALSGLFLQSLLRNPLAEPFILGLSSGAGLGVMIALYVGHVMKLGDLSASSQTLPAVAGSLATLAIVFALSHRRRVLDPVSLILIGTVCSTIAGAGIMFFQHLVPTGLRAEFTTWLMGFIPEVASPSFLFASASLTFFAIIVGLVLAKSMDAATLGDDEARSVGLHLPRFRAILFTLAGILAAVTVALAGPIGFVGLVAPHASRFILGPRHAPLVIASACIGASIILAADSFRQMLDFGAGRMPIGILTALFGGPVFIYLLLSGRGRA
ncbi:MAG TPA: iron ABC transporter permease [Phycisphaerales bacterium]|nr:iron ABC transporter permease [Phycisphaerales bacterium]